MDPDEIVEQFYQGKADETEHLLIQAAARGMVEDFDQIPPEIWEDLRYDARNSPWTDEEWAEWTIEETSKLTLDEFRAGIEAIREYYEIKKDTKVKCLEVNGRNVMLQDLNYDVTYTYILRGTNQPWQVMGSWEKT